MFQYYQVICLTTLWFSFTTQVSSQCDSMATSGSNLGIYGGYAKDIKLNSANNRVFAAFNSPYSVFISDDTCKTWYKAFDPDSLQYNCGKDGWGGGGNKILVNNGGWVLAQTKEHGGNLSAAVINYNNGDVSKWKTLITPNILLNQGYGTFNLTNIELTNYQAYATIGPYLIEHSQVSQSVTNIPKLISGLDSTDKLISIGVSNNLTGLPKYFIVDTVDNDTSEGLLFKYDGTNFEQLKISFFLKNEFIEVFTNKNDTIGDTIFVSTKDDFGSPMNFSSYDGGYTWNNISISSQAQLLINIHYKKNWVNSYPLSNGLILSSQNFTSVDLGVGWNQNGQDINSQNVDHAVIFTDTSLVIASNAMFPVTTVNGLKGTYFPETNIGLEAINVKKIARSKAKNVFAVVTDAGLAVTNDFKNSSIESFERWSYPYGEYPVYVSAAISDENISAVAINPFDSLNIVVGISQTGFAYTLNGLQNFSVVFPSSFNSNNYTVNDILFLDSNVVIATTGALNEVGADTVGHIWRSNDKGKTWDNITPNGFNNGNAITIGYNPDTTIYVGTGFDGAAKGFLWKSYDKGNSWIKINHGPISYDGAMDSLVISDLEVNPNNHDTLYLTTSEAYASFAMSTDGGNSYTTLDINAGGNEFSSVIVDINNPDSIYVSSRKRIWAYLADSNKNTLMYLGLPGEMINDLANGSLLCGTSTGFYGITLEPYPDLVVGEGNFMKITDKVFLYPNPAGDYLNIYIDNKSEIRDVQVYDILGNRYPVKINSKKVSLSNLPSGLYLLSVNIENINYHNTFNIIK